MFNVGVLFQDSYGDTALHDAIGKDSKEIVEMLVGHPGIDFTLRNKRGFNVLHHAALKGNNQWVEQHLLSYMYIIGDTQIQLLDCIQGVSLVKVNKYF